jgi:hypothetical protein
MVKYALSWFREEIKSKGVGWSLFSDESEGKKIKWLYHFFIVIYIYGHKYLKSKY